MTDLREAAQMALDALLQSETDPYAQIELSAQEDAAIEALRAALAQPEPEPVAWMTVTMGEVTSMQPHMIASEMLDGTYQLYTAPPQREWQGLTDEERQECLFSDPIFGMAASTFARAIESKLKEKNT